MSKLGFMVWDDEMERLIRNIKASHPSFIVGTSCRDLRIRLEHVEAARNILVPTQRGGEDEKGKKRKREKRERKWRREERDKVEGKNWQNHKMMSHDWRWTCKMNPA